MLAASCSSSLLVDQSPYDWIDISTFLLCLSNSVIGVILLQVVLERLDTIGGQLKEWWADDGMCDDGKADLAVERISDVLANIWLETAVQVRCIGVGFACGWTAIETPAWFDSVGDALDLVAAESGAEEARFCATDMKSLAKDVDVDVETARKEVSVGNSQFKGCLLFVLD